MQIGVVDISTLRLRPIRKRMRDRDQSARDEECAPWK